MGALSLLFSLGLVFAYKKLKVYEDPKIEQISEILPQAIFDTYLRVLHYLLIELP